MFFFKKRKKVQTQQQPSEPAPESLCVTTVLTPEKTSILEIANLQGLGQREQQQDAFGISPADRYETDGILAVLCDGMGGMAEGQRIAIQTVSCLLNHFPFPEPQTKAVSELIFTCTRKIYQQFYGHGGCTLVAAWILGNQLHFWSVGDSDLFLAHFPNISGRRRSRWTAPTFHFPFFRAIPCCYAPTESAIH